VASAIQKDGGQALAVAANVTRRDEVEQLVARAVGEFGRLDVLINNAGINRDAMSHKMTEEQWDQVLAVNLTGTYLCTREVLPAMLKQDYGRVVNVASTAGLVGYAYVSAYCAAKHGVIGLTRSLALEAAKTAVTVNAVCPGYTETDMVKNTVANIMAKTGKSEAEARAALTSHNPQGRTVLPGEVANAVLWLCLPGSEAITGQPISVAGGEVM